MRTIAICCLILSLSGCRETEEAQESPPQEKTQPAVTQDTADTEPESTSPKSRLGFLVSTRNGLRLVTSSGNVRTLPDEDPNHRLTGQLAIRQGRIFVYNVYGPTIKEIDPAGNVLRTISVDPQAKGIGFVPLPENRFAILDNEKDRISLLNPDGSLDTTLPMSLEKDGHLQNVSGVVVDGTLIVSEDGHSQLLKVDLDTRQVTVFYPLGNRYGLPGAITYQDGTYFLCNKQKVYSFLENSELQLVATLDQGNIRDVSVHDKYAYVCVNFTGAIYKIDLASGEAALFAEGLNYPSSLVGVEVTE